MIPTDNASARKREIEEKLEKVTILSSFESRLVRLENAIIPVHRQTENLQRLQDNVDQTLACLDLVISHYHVAKDTDKVIREGPAGKLEEYLACIAEIQKAVEFFQHNNPDSPELNTVRARFEKGKELLEAEFRGLLTRYSKPVPPVLILDAVGGDEELEEVQEEVMLEHLPEAVLQDVICISSWLAEHARNQDFMNVYYQIRSSQLERSLRGLREHFRKHSTTSTSSGSLCSPAMQAKRKDTPTRKLPKRPGTIRKVLKQYSQHGLEGRKGSSAFLPLEGKDDLLDVEIDSFIYCISAFVKLAQSEHGLLTHIIPEHHQKKTFDSLIQEALDGLMQEGDGIVAAAGRAIARHDYSTVLSIFPVLRHLKLSKPDFDTTLQVSTPYRYASTLQGTAASTKNKLPTLIIAMETTGAKALEEFADSIKVRCAWFSGKALGNLQLNLLNKSKVYDYSALSAIFLLNNYNYILKSLQNWWRVTEFLMDRNTPTFQPGTKLKDKERQLIKDKFKGFNEGLEELCKVQKVWAVPDQEQREAIRQAQRRLVSEAYRNFLHRYANISFTKNPDKYVKYRVEQVEEMIGRLFDTSA
ncbi:hypothetical protein JZ751_015739 [Albula glossodonta]|uniref:Exocyst complex component 7 n=2 Tax=Albula glossodonta TaxID=121402 RepID=A0A8T2MWW5_9TELE|nr:hypothetical protein JZ751_015739 [Albula glossodonta]